MKTSRKKRTYFTQESEVVEVLLAFLEREGYRVREEVPTLGQSADIVATRGRWVTVIEVKRHDWRNAIRQCMAHAQVADFVCIAIGTQSVSDRAVNEIAAYGYGLLHCGAKGECRWVLRPKMNKSLWAPQRRRLSKVLRGISYAG